MQVWLHPVEIVTEDTSPIVAVLARIQKVCEDANYNDPGSLKQIIHDACYAMPGNLEQTKGNYDPSEYAQEVIQTERVRLGFWSRLKDAMQDIANVFDPFYGIEWCLPFLDYDFNFIKHDRFITGVGKFPGLHCYLCVADANTPLVENWQGRSGITVIGETLMQTMAPTVGFSTRQPPKNQGFQLPIPQAGGILPSYKDVPGVNQSDEESEEWPKDSASKKKYRSIDDM